MIIMLMIHMIQKKREGFKYFEGKKTFPFKGKMRPPYGDFTREREDRNAKTTKRRESDQTEEHRLIPRKRSTVARTEAKIRTWRVRDAF